MHNCPKCKSTDVTVLEEDDLLFIECNKCGYSDLEDIENLNKKTSQREKAKYSPYKTGGKNRTR
ncbi:MAG: hypothetical protein Q8Q01_04525 [archaeon]|nr:hypothetical protein [archaeon]